jgi:2-deoxy-D-gluconate 3-dehydrogenase
MKQFDLTGRVAVVTGGHGGIGYGIASALSEAGAAVAIAGRRHDRNVSAAASLRSEGRRVVAVEVDVTNEASNDAMLREVRDLLGSVSILVNNAGITIRKPPEAFSLEEWTQVLDTNLTGAFLCSKSAYPHLVDAGGGKIINIGSMLSLFGLPLSAPYGASKGGLVQLARSFATAWAKDNIQVNTILPGWIDTAMAQSARREHVGLNERVLSRTPAGRWGQPCDIGGAAVFLSSSASDFVTGASLPVDGGYSISG